MAIVPPGVAQGRADAWERTMRNLWMLVACVCAALGCGDDGPGGPMRRSCSELGLNCGVDDYGTACGTCLGNEVCNFGVCALR